ncbi:MAG: serine/threonine-protein kinase, partial [Chloroflexota bacterium]
MASLQGSIVGRYQIAGFLARGGRSIIYEALAPDTGRRVALKILPPSTARDPDRVEVFLRLAAKLAKLEQANLLPVVDYGREDGVPFSVSPIARGGRLQDDLDTYHDPQTALVLVLDLAQAVDHLHQNQILHGRIGPDHVLFDAQGEPLLTGAGWPYTAGDPGPAPAYLAPEQIQGQKPDERTDVYQLGALLHQLLLGQPADPGADLQVAYEVAGIDEHLAAILVEALQPAPEDRFQTAAELADQLSLVGQQLVPAGVGPDDGLPEDKSLADEPPDDAALDVEAPADELLDEDLLTDESPDVELLGDEQVADESLDEDLLIDESLDDELPEP